MTPPPGDAGLRRIEHSLGELLRAVDMRDSVAYDTRLRELHVRGLHRTWGVALGFATLLVRGAKAVVIVGPGLAYDCSGREIVSSEGVALALPEAPPAGAPPRAYDLVVSWRRLEPAGPGPTPCQKASSLQREQADIRWWLAGEVSGDAPLPVAPGARLGEGIPLARLVVASDTGPADLDLSVRRSAQGLVRPHIAGDRLRAGTLPVTGSPAAWSVEVDTSSGGFSSVPSYFAMLVDHPFGDRSGFASSLADTGDDGALATGLLGPFVAIRSPQLRGFTLEVRAAQPGSGILGPELRRPALTTLPVSVDWIGIEPVTGCPPSFDATRAVFDPWLVTADVYPFVVAAFASGTVTP